MSLTLNQINPFASTQLIFLTNEQDYLAEPGYGTFNQDHLFSNLLM